VKKKLAIRLPFYISANPHGERFSAVITLKPLPALAFSNPGPRKGQIPPLLFCPKRLVNGAFQPFLQN